MDYKNTIEIITHEIREVEELVAGFVKHSEIPRIELDLALDKVRKVYDTLIMIEKSNLKTTESKIEKVKKSVKEQFVEKDEEKVVEFKVAPENMNVSDVKEEEQNKGQTEKTNEPEPEIISDKFQGTQTYRDEVLTPNRPISDLSAKLHSKPIKDLNAAIGLNEKFIFINELFNGDSGTYKKVIEILNNATNFNEAFNYLNENFDWDMENDTVQRILELVRRKFITLENE